MTTAWLRTCRLLRRLPACKRSPATRSRESRAGKGARSNQLVVLGGITGDFRSHYFEPLAQPLAPFANRLHITAEELGKAVVAAFSAADGLQEPPRSLAGRESQLRKLVCPVRPRRRVGGWHAGQRLLDAAVRRSASANLIQETSVHDLPSTVSPAATAASNTTNPSCTWSSTLAATAEGRRRRRRTCSIRVSRNRCQNWAARAISPHSLCGFSST